MPRRVQLPATRLSPALAPAARRFPQAPPRPGSARPPGTRPSAVAGGHERAAMCRPPARAAPRPGAALRPRPERRPAGGGRVCGRRAAPLCFQPSAASRPPAAGRAGWVGGCRRPLGTPLAEAWGAPGSSPTAQRPLPAWAKAGGACGPHPGWSRVPH